MFYAIVEDVRGVLESIRTFDRVRAVDGYQLALFKDVALDKTVRDYYSVTLLPARFRAKAFRSFRSHRVVKSRFG